MIEEVKKFTNEEGKGITMYCPIAPDGEDKIPQTNPKYQVHFDGTVGVRGPMGIQPIHFPFPKDYTLEKCFEEFEDVADVEIKKIMEELESKQKKENLIITPGQANSGGTQIQSPPK